MLNFNRRDFLKAGAAVSLVGGLPRSGSAQGTFAPQPGAWREFQIVTRLEIANAKGKTQAWIPVPAVNEKEWFKSSPSQWTTNGDAGLERDPQYGAEMVHVEWLNLQAAPVAEVISTIKVRDRAVDLSKPGNPVALSATELKLYTGGTDLVPTDNRQGDFRQNYEGRSDRSGEGPRYLRMGRREYIPRRESAWLWHR